jgi:hypothetical protein
VKVWIVEGEHHSTPGMIVKVCASKDLADKEAADLVMIIVNDLAGGCEGISPDNWERRLDEAVVEYAGHYNCMPRVEVSEHKVIAA